MRVCAALAAAVLASATLAGQGTARPASSAPIRGLDHVPIAVASLDAAAARFRALGFTLKPGQVHPNGISNQHAKFSDGTELELITAPASRDDLTKYYRDHLARGDGPAFVALFAPARTDLVQRIERDLPRYIFFGPRNASPTDLPEHFRHPNTAQALRSVWLAGADLSAEWNLLERMGAVMTHEVRDMPERTPVTVATFEEGEVLLLPAARELVPGRRVVGATVRVRSLAFVERLRPGGVAPTVVRGALGASVFLKPELANGLWLEFREGVY
jgi:catechol 2,3-dioxygenase-like lactoylglutathione lyase family enzyme